MKKSVLVAEDDKDVQELYVSALSDEYSLKIVADGSEFRQVLYSSFVVDFIISDINMPKVNGLEILKEIKASAAPLSHVPMTIITAFPDRQVILKTLELGASDIFIKPFFPLDLCNHIKLKIRPQISLEEILRMIQRMHIEDVRSNPTNGLDHSALSNPKYFLFKNEESRYCILVDRNISLKSITDCDQIGSLVGKMEIYLMSSSEKWRCVWPEAHEYLESVRIARDQRIIS